MGKNVKFFVIIVSLILSISMMSACSDSSSDNVGKSWSSLNISDAYDLQSALSVGSKIYAGGLGSNNKVGLWIVENNAVSEHLDVADTFGVTCGIAEDVSGDLYLGWYSPVQGYVAKYDPATGAISDTGLSGAGIVSDITAYNGLVYAGGQTSDSTPAGEVWQYDGSSWTGMNVSGLNNVACLTFYKDTLYIAGIDSSSNYAKVLAYVGGIWTDVQFPYSAPSIWVMTAGGSNLYVGGTDSSYDGQVWKYNGKDWNGMDLKYSNDVYALLVDSSSFLYAGGEDNEEYDGQVWKYDNAKWESTGLLGAKMIYALVEGADGSIYAVGTDDPFNNGQMWKYQ
ncbi:MAG: hypothetical protein KJ573_01370 [Proteobacteria bacterium]|nr:hypothetical protein [Desulfobacteraceae bacterium]MBU0733847.1 hypothetical protein [Pseudomonadota bacterium]MBU1902224.1 hypothetical protein [Pseudomonadota bacterium]